MTQKFVRLSLAVSAATLLAAAPASAKQDQPLTVIAPAIHTVRVPYGDLNLRDGNAVAMLQARVDEASLKVCKATNFAPILDGVDRSTCIVNARIGARPQIASAVERASRGESLALGAAIRVSAAL